MIVQIDKDILDSLKGFYFNDYSDIIRAACYRAYRDFNRTINFPVKMKNLNKYEKKEEEKKRLELKNSILDLFRIMIIKLRSINELDQMKFDYWHNSVCDSIIKKYNNKNIELKYGQAQKWLNMTIKYLYCLGENFDKEFSFFHIPVDNYILDIALERLNIEKPKSVWRI
ncbi:MAG: hypothetical protein PHU32_04565 [Candidatus ainarchaeum sp.]|nr:hypothetical protein [Candidatus ainarchaeum sp.]